MAGSTALTFKLFGHDVSASKALKGVGKAAGISAGVLGGMAAMDLGRKAVAFAQDTVNAFGDLGGQTMKLQRFLGGTAEESSRLAHAFAMTGIDTDTAAKSLGIFSKFTAGAADQLDAYQSKQAAAAQAGKPFHGVLTGSAAAVAQLGVKLRDSNGEIRPTSDLLVDMAEQISKMPAGVDKTAFVMKAFGKSGMSMLPFLNKGAAGIEELKKQSDELGTTLSGGDLDAVKENTKAKRTFGEAIKGLQVTLGRELFPILTAVTRFLSGTLVPVIRNVVGWIKENKQIVGLAAGAIGTVVAAFKVWSIAMAVFNAIAAANPISLIVIAIAALVAGIIYAYNNFEGFRNVVQAVWAAIQTAVGVVVDWFSSTVWPVLRQVIGFIVGYYKFLFAALKVVWTGIWNAISAVVSWFASTVWPKIRTVIGWIAAYYRFLWNALKVVWTGIWNAISAVVSWFGNTAWPAIRSVASSIKGVFDTVWTKVREVWSNVWSKIETVVGNIRTAASNIKSAFSGIWDGIVGAARAAFNGLASAWNSTIGQFSWTVPDWVPAIGGSTFSAPQIPYLAAGGIVTRPTLAMVGEAGAEAVVPLSRGARYGLGPSTETNITVNISGVVGDRHAVARTVVDAIDSAITAGTLRPRRLVVNG